MIFSQYKRIQQTARLLQKALLNHGAMSYTLYQYELEEHIDYWYQGLKEDQNTFVYAVTEHSGDVAMVLITEDKTVYINEDARQELINFWPKTYKHNITKLIPMMAKDIVEGFVSVDGVSVYDGNK